MPTLALVLSLGVGVSCTRRSKRQSAPPLTSASAASQASVTVSAAPAPSGAAELLVTLPTSAYHARLTLDGETIYVLTQNAAHRLVPGKPPARMPLELGFGATATEGGLLYWSEGAIFRAPKLGGEPQRLVAAQQQPAHLVATAERFAWVEQSTAGRFRILTRDEAKPKTLYTSPGRIETAIMVGDWVFFVERPTLPKWRIGRVPTTGAGASFTTSRAGRAPSMLGSWDDQIYFYAGLDLGVRRLTPDFAQEETIAKGVVCSPLAVAQRIYCARVEGLFALPLEGGAPEPLTDNDHKLVAEIAANEQQVVWISEAGDEQLSVSRLAVGQR